jgi:diguanylate cyclase (GGDEF)-like protein
VTSFAEVRLSVLDLAAERSMWALSLPAWTIESDEVCGTVDAILHSDEGASHTSLVVLEPGTGRVGSVSRQRFEQQMSGRYGFGRALMIRTPVSRVTDWDISVLPGSVALAEAVHAVLSRPEHTRYDDLLLHRADLGRDGWRRLPAGAVLEALAASMARRASRDELTGLLNRSAFLEYLTEAGHDVLDTGRRIAVIFVDLDRMKLVNDTLGHVAGDALLCSVAGRLNAAARSDDLIGRLGGDEFAVAFTIPAIDEQQTRTYVSRVAQRYLAELRMADPNLDPRSRSAASLGVSISSGVGPVSVEALLREADVAMYAAKKAGGDQVVLSTPATGVLEDGRVEEPPLSIEQALANQELELYYQPIVDARSGRITSLEALLRWQHPNKGLLGADQVLAAATAEHALIAVDSWVLHTALDRLRSWIELLGEQAPSWINVNLSSRSLANPHLAAMVLAALTEAEVEPGRLRLELPETSTLRLVPTVTDELCALSEAGVQLVLDDMGGSASALSHLSTLTISEMKIDRLLVSRMHVDERTRTVIQMLIGLATGLSMQITAEGIESVQQLRYLKGLGIDCVQGFYVCPPLAAPTDQLLLEVTPPPASSPGRPPVPDVGTPVPHRV